MTTPHETRTQGRKGHLLTRICIWSIRNHSWLASRIQMYMYSAVAILLLMVLAGRLSLEAALQAIGFGGLGMLTLICGLIVTRRNHLLALSDPELKQQAYDAMLALIAVKDSHTVSAAKKRAPSKTGLDSCDHC